MASGFTLDKIFSVLVDQQSLNDSMATTMLSSGVTLMQQKKYQQAAVAFKQATVYRPDYLDGYNFMAQAYLKLGKRKEAIEAYKLSVRIDGTQDSVHVNLASIYIEDKRPADAEKELRAAMKTNPANVVAPYTLGQLFVQQGRTQEAETLFRKVVRMSPRDGNAYYGLGLALNKEGKTDEAIQSLEKAVSLKKDFSAALYELGTAYAAVGKTDKVQQQISALSALGTSDGDTNSASLTELIRHPKFVGIQSSNSSFTRFSLPMDLFALDSTLIAPGSSREFTMTFLFDSAMDTASVMDVTKWSITKSRGGTAGLYDNGLYRPTDIPVPVVPTYVSYDPANKSATVAFTLYQNADGTGTIDPSKIVFSFMGKDVTGKQMDTSADQYGGITGNIF